MQTLEAALKNLYEKRLVAYDDIILKTSRPDDLKRIISAGSAV
jgi:hypothetical protein